MTQVSATPLGPDTASVSITGTLKTFQQYADMMIALYRIPGATTVTRQGYTNVDPYIPNVNDVDQNGRPIKPGQTNIPDDKYERLAYYQSQGTLTGFTGTGGFGTGDTTQAKGAMPGYSLVTFNVVIPRALQTPNPRATLQAQGAAGAAPTTGTAPGTQVPIPGR
jgi:hypothetical protein